MTAKPAPKVSTPLTRCPKCDKPSSRLLHQVSTGIREAYTDPEGRAWYRCLTHGVFSISGAGLAPVLDRVLVKKASNLASTLISAIEDWRERALLRSEPLGLAVEAAKRFAKAGEDALTH